MTSERVLKRLWDADDALGTVAMFVHERSFDEFLTNDMLRSAVERKLEIVGEALSAIRKLDAEFAARIPLIDAIVGFRNVLVHGYMHLNNQTSWDTATIDAPKLRLVLAQLLAEAE